MTILTCAGNKICTEHCQYMCGCVYLYRCPICVSVCTLLIGGNRWFCLFAHVELTWQAVRLSTPSSCCCCYYCCDKCFSPEQKKLCRRQLGLSIHAKMILILSLPPLSLSLSLPFSLSLSLSLTLSMVFIYLIACKKKHKRTTTSNTNSKQSTSSKSAGKLSVCECTHKCAHTTFEYINNLLCVCACRCCFCKNKLTTWSDSSSTLFEYLFALVFLVVVIVFPDWNK